MEKQRREMLRDRIIAGRRSELTRNELIELLDYIDELEAKGEDSAPWRAHLPKPKVRAVGYPIEKGASK